jgi:3D (Asp-Asp-Asp) domain-containing protein
MRAAALTATALVAFTFLPVQTSWSDADADERGILDNGAFADRGSDRDRDVRDEADRVELSAGGVQSDGVDWWLAGEDAAGDDAAAPLVVELPWTARATVTAYCHGGLMRSGRQTYVGAVATDRSVIPEGSLVTIEGLGGPYVSEDTGSGVRGWWVDVFTPDCGRAQQIGRSQRAIRVERWGW